MISSAGQGYSLLDEEPRFLRQRIDRLRSSSLIVQKQKIVWCDSIQQECKRTPQREEGCTSTDSQSAISSTRLIPRKRYIILRPGNDVVKVAKCESRHDCEEPIKKSIIIPTLSEAAIKPPPNSVRTIPRTSAPRAVTQYVLKIPVVRKHYDSSSLKRAVVAQSRAEHSVMTMRIPTVPPSMSMGGEYIEEENDDEDAFGCNDNDSLIHESTFATKDCDCFDSKPLFHCPELDCFWRGDSESAVQRHLQSSHVKKTPVITEKSLKSAAKMVGKPKGVRCSECDALAYSRPLLLKHMTQIHGIEAPIMHRTFDDREELQQWLEQLRSTHAVEFVVSSGSKKWGFGLQVHYLTCSRSGEQKERPNKKFARPPRPSIKCGKNCMAYLKIKQNPVTSVLQVEGCLHHSGHMIDGSLIQLTPSEWRKVEAVAEQYERDQLAWEIDAERFTLNGVRDVLGHYGRFRLIPDQQLTFLLKQWMKEYNDQRISHEAVFPYPNANIKFNPDSFDIIQTNMIPMLDDFGEYDSNSPASPIPGV